MHVGMMNEEERLVKILQLSHSQVLAGRSFSQEQAEDFLNHYTVDKKGILLVTPDIEEEIAEVERGEVVSMAEFKTMFSRWLD